MPFQKGQSGNPDKQFKPGESGNPSGKPPGRLNLSTHIQNMLNDEEFEVYLQHPTKGYESFKGAPIKAIVKTALIKAAAGDDKAREWLAKYGYGQKFEVEHSGEIETGIANPALAEAFAEYLKKK
jgi:uncharacterized protein DUF5681